MKAKSNCLSSVLASKSDRERRSFVEIVGNATCLLGYGIRLPASFVPRPFAERLRVLDDARTEWEVWGEHAFSLHARRERTQDEHEAWVDRCNARLAPGWFSVDRLAMIDEIAAALIGLANSSGGDQEEEKFRLSVLADALWEVASPNADMASLRGQLLLAGVEVSQRDYMEAFTKSGRGQA